LIHETSAIRYEMFQRPRTYQAMSLGPAEVDCA
jgi:hypothetical protein